MRHHPSVRAVAIASMVLASVSAHAVTFDPSTPIGSPPVLLTATSGLGSMTVNVNSYSLNTPAAVSTYPGAPAPIQLFSSDARYVVASYAGFDANPTAEGGVAITSGGLYAGYAAPVYPYSAVPGPVRADFAVGLATQFSDPSAVGMRLDIRASDNANYSGYITGADGHLYQSCGLGCFLPVTLVMPTYHLVVSGTTDTGQVVTLLDETKTSDSFDDVINTSLGGHLSNVSGRLELTNNPTGFRYYVSSITLTPTSAVPEPAAASLWLMGALGLMAAARCRRA